ncbi:tRNA 2-thiouridine(34) synthase TusD [Pasteurellaceae bacterium RH1A]|nr:tRNA 2-thiouridine(34) synthase TusD [Pasteurellaceae bacterium RH1A]
MRYVLAIKSPVYGSQAAYLAYQFAQVLLEEGHEIRQVFFFQNGVSHANSLINPASDEFNLQTAWQNLAQTHRLSLHLCIAAAQRRGVVNQETAKNGEDNLAQGFTLAGLGEFSQAVLEADRLITF